MMIRFDTSDLAALSSDLTEVGARSIPAMRGVFKEAGESLVKTWASNARETAGTHGKHYPDSIDADFALSKDIVVEVGPNPSRPQGGMSFEYGSVNQPPHLDGQRAADWEIPRLERRVEIALTHLLGPL